MDKRRLRGGSPHLRRVDAAVCLVSRNIRERRPHLMRSQNERQLVSSYLLALTGWDLKSRGLSR